MAYRRPDLSNLNMAIDLAAEKEMLLASAYEQWAKVLHVLSIPEMPFVPHHRTYLMEVAERQEREMRYQLQRVNAAIRKNQQLYRDQQQHVHTFYKPVWVKAIKHERRLSVHQQQEKEQKGDTSTDGCRATREGA